MSLRRRREHSQPVPPLPGVAREAPVERPSHCRRDSHRGEEGVGIEVVGAECVGEANGVGLSRAEVEEGAGRGLVTVPCVTEGRRRAGRCSSGRKMPMAAGWSRSQGAVGPSSASSSNAGGSGRGTRDLRVLDGRSGGGDGPLVRVDGCEDGGDRIGVVDSGDDSRELAPPRPASNAKWALQGVDGPHSGAAPPHPASLAQLMRRGRLGATGTGLSAEGVGTISAGTRRGSRAAGPVQRRHGIAAAPGRVQARARRDEHRRGSRAAGPVSNTIALTPRALRPEPRGGCA